MRLSESPELVSTSKEGIGPPPTSPMHVRNVAFTLLSIAIVILLLQYMQPVLLPLILGALLFYALDPAVDRLQRLHVPRAIGAALVLVIVVTSGGVLVYTLQGQALTVIDPLAPPAATPRSPRPSSRTAQTGKHCHLVHDGDQGHLRSCGAASARRTSAGRISVREARRKTAGL